MLSIFVAYSEGSLEILAPKPAMFSDGFRDLSK